MDYKDICELPSPTYRLAASASTQSFTVTGAERTEKVIISNNTNVPIAVTSGSSGVSATFPAAGASAGVSIILSGQTQPYRKPLTHTHIAVICQSAPAASDVFVQFGGL